MSLYLTNRDYKILDYLSNQGFALIEQIQTLGFPTKEATKVRLAALQRAGFLTSEVIETPSPMRKWLREISGYSKEQITYGLNRRKIYKPIHVGELRKGVDRTHNMMRHQLGLNRTLEQLMQEFENPVLLTESDIEHENRLLYGGDLKVFPDLVIVESKVKLAVEYERSVKSKSRLLERWYRYKTSALFTHVLYVCETQSVFDKLTKLARSQNKIGFTILSDLKKVFSNLGWQSIQKFIHSR